MSKNEIDYKQFTHEELLVLLDFIKVYSGESENDDLNIESLIKINTVSKIVKYVNDMFELNSAKFKESNEIPIFIDFTKIIDPMFKFTTNTNGYLSFIAKCHINYSNIVFVIPDESDEDLEPYKSHKQIMIDLLNKLKCDIIEYSKLKKIESDKKYILMFPYSHNFKNTLDSENVIIDNSIPFTNNDELNKLIFKVWARILY